MKNFFKALALTSAIAATTAHATDIAITTGGEGGMYERIGYAISQQIKAQAQRKKTSFDVEVINSNGSIDNIELMNEGDANIAIVQADALNVNEPRISYKAKTAHTETVFWIYNKKNGFKDLGDIEGSKKALMVIVDGSGAMTTIQSFVNEDGGYKANLDNAILADDLYDAVDIVSEGKYNGSKVAGVLYVGGKIPSEIVSDFGNKVAIGEATDSDFNDAKDVNGDKLYTNCEVSDRQMNGMKDDKWGSPDTVCMKAMVVYSTQGYDNPKELKIIKKAVNKAVRGLK